MVITLMEGVIDAVATYLETNMAAALDVIDAEYDDGITLVDIATYYKAETQAVPKTPAIYVLGDSTVPEAEGPTHMKAAHNMTIVVVVTDNVNETLRKRLYRHVRAIVDILRDARADDTFAAREIVFDSFEFSPMYGASGTFMQDAHVALHVSAIETE